MADPTNEPEPDSPLNPALKSRRDTTYDTRNVTPPPFDTASAREGEGEIWPVVWLVVTIVCVALAIYFLV